MSERVRPISPEEAAAEQLKQIPDAALESFNELLAKKGSRQEIIVYQDDVIKRMQEKGLRRDEIFDKGWLDVEDAYRDAGWKVVYDKPAYNETGRAFFKFSRPKKNG